jgi:hypothetical protein
MIPHVVALFARIVRMGTYNLFASVSAHYLYHRKMCEVPENVQLIRQRLVLLGSANLQMQPRATEVRWCLSANGTAILGEFAGILRFHDGNPFTWLIRRRLASLQTVQSNLGGGCLCGPAYI